MKNHTIVLFALTGAAVLSFDSTLAFAGTHKRASAPVVITMPAIPNGSNSSRAPFPAARPQNDVTPPNGEAFDQSLPPNTPATTPAPFASPPPRFALFQPRVAPGLMPTGRLTIGAASALDANHVDPMIRTAAFESRDDVVDNVRVRLRNSEGTVVAFERSEGEMSATGRSQFDNLRSEVNARRKAVEKDARVAANAESADWESARAQLAADYEAYATAASQMDAAVGAH